MFIIKLYLLETGFFHILLDLFEISKISFTLIVFSSIGIFITVIFYTRLFGKRSFSKMSSFDFAMTVAVGSMIATAILSESVSFLEGAIALLMLYCLQLFTAFFRRKKWVRELIDNKPTLLMDGETILTKNMKAVRVTESDLRSKLREANVIKLSDIKAVIFETTGDISVIHKDNNELIDDYILKDVRR